MATKQSKRITPAQSAPAPAAALTVNLDELFRKESKARVVAERVLTGRPQTREQLVEGLDLSLTTVPRVIDALRGAGVDVERSTNRARQAVYSAKAVTNLAATEDRDHGPVISRFMHTSGELLSVTVTKVEVLDGTLWMDLTVTSSGRAYRGRASGEGGLNIPASLLAGAACIVGMVVHADGAVGWLIGDDRSSVLLSDPEYVG